MSNIEYLKSVSIDNLCLSVRFFNSVISGSDVFFEDLKGKSKYDWRENINLYHLVKMDENQYLKIRNFGVKTLSELSSQLSVFGLKIAMSDEEIEVAEIKRISLPVCSNTYPCFRHDRYPTNKPL
jgi:hypothetical protein